MRGDTNRNINVDTQRNGSKQLTPAVMHVSGGQRLTHTGDDIKAFTVYRQLQHRTIDEGYIRQFAVCMTGPPVGNSR